MISEIFGVVSQALKGIVSDGDAGDAQRKKTLTDIAGMISGHKVGLDANLAKQAKKNIGQFPIIISNAIGDEQALKTCEIVERTIADMILLCIQNGNNLLDLRDPESKRKFIESYTNAGRNSLDNNGSNLDYLVSNIGKFKSDYQKNCVSGIDAITLKQIANEAMYLEDMNITSSFEMSTLFNPCLSVEEEFAMGAVAPVSVPMGVATGNSSEDDEYDDDDEVNDEFAAESKKNKKNPKPGFKPFPGGATGAAATGTPSGTATGAGAVPPSSPKSTKPSSTGKPPKKNPLYAAPRGTSGGRKVLPWKARLDGTKEAKIEEKVSKLSPTIVNATVLLQTPTDTLERNLAFGVKVNAHEVASDELVKAIKDTYSSTSLVSRLIRWRSGELSFFKDVLLNLKEIKQTVAAKNGRNTKNGLSGVFASMRFMTKNSIAYDAFTANGSLLPTVSIMMTLDEVDQIRNSCSKDLIKNTKDARELCNKLGLFGILIVDAANDAFYSFFNDDSIMYNKTSLKDNKNKNSDDVVKAIFGALKR